MTAPRLPRFAALLLLVAGFAPLHGETPEPAPEEAVLKSARQAADGPALLEFFRKRTLSDDDLTELAAKVQRLGSAAFPVRQKATRELIAAGRPALVALRPALKDDDPERKRRAEQCIAAIEADSDLPLSVAAAHVLALRPPAGSVEVVLRYLPQADDDQLEEELITVLRAAGIRDGKADPALSAALKDASPVRRGAAAFVLGRLPEKARPRVEALLEDADPRVRFRAAEGLLAGKKKEAIPVLVALLETGPDELAYLAEEDLGRIAGEQAPQRWLTSAGGDERRKCRAAWEAWWKEHGPNLQIAALEVEHRQLGFTLICCCDGYNDGKGKVWEVDRKRQMRWEINNVNYPVDAVMIANNRVLIAEQNGMCVTERDTQGNVLWKHEVSERLVSCQRLANGNTFLATYMHLFEVTREHKELYNYTTKHGTIYSAAKLPDGHIGYLGADNVLAELDDNGREVRALKVDASGAGLFKFEPLSGGRFLLGQNVVQKVVEFDGDGKVLWECPLSNANSVERLPSGNVLACSWADKRVVEISRGGKVLWELSLGGGPLRIQRR